MKKKTASKILSVFLAVAIVFCSAPLSGFTGIELPDLFSMKAEAEEYTEGNFTYSVSNGNATLTSYGVDATVDIVIPETLGGYPVISIGNNAFRYCTRLNSVTIPDSVISIGVSAFYGCVYLTSVIIPDSVTSIGAGAFYFCERLETVTIPNSVTSIGASAFYGCTSLETVTIPDSITSIGSSAFYDCISLARVYYTGNIESWCSIEFDDSFANPVSYANNFYINNTLVKELVIPDTVTEIKAYTFYGFEGITSVTISDHVTSIGEFAFYFHTILYLTSVYFEGTESQWSEIEIDDGNDYLINAEKTFLNGGHEHSYSSSVTTEPTCTEEGVKTFKCGCGDTYTESIPATGHTWSKWVVATEPTETADGTRVRICKVCEDAAEFEEIPATGSGGITITLTDENGNVVIKEIISDYMTDISFENGTYTLTISKENYVSRTYTVTAADNMLSVDFSLNKIGDINGDGRVNTVDVARANAHAKGMSTLSGYDFDCVDINADGRVNTVDVARMNAHAKGVTTLW